MTRARVLVAEERNARRRAIRRGEVTPRRWQRTKPLAPPADPAVLFWTKVNTAGACWLWTAAVDKDGYGKFQVTLPGENRQRHVRAHQFAFFDAHGRWPSRHLLHACDTPACVRPFHLYEGTQAENRQDCVRRGREPRGHKKPNAKLNAPLVAAAKALVRKGGVLADFASAHGVNYSTLWQAVRGRTWRHVP